MSNDRVKILSKSEIQELFSIPQFTKGEQQTYFSLNKQEYKLMNSRYSIASKVHFILQLGYFKATSQFFNCSFSEVANDCDYILHEYFAGAKLNVKTIAKQTRQTNQSLIAELLGYICDKNKISTKLQKMLKIKTKLSNNPVYLFHEVLCYCEQHKLMILGYSSIQNLIGTAIFDEEKRIGNRLGKLLTQNEWTFIKNLLNKSDNEYLITALKRDPKSFQLKHIKVEIKKLRDHADIYAAAVRVLPKLKLSSQSINYYANLAEHYQIKNLQNLSPRKQAIYLLCFVLHRYKKINDNLAVSFIHYLNKFTSEAANKARDRIVDEKVKINDDTKNAAIALRFFDDEDIPNRESFGGVRKKAYKHLKKGKYAKVADYLLGVLFDYQAIKWEEIKKLKNKIATNIRPIFNALEFSAANSSKDIILAIDFLKKYFASTTKERSKLIRKAPIGCIPKQWRKYLMTTDDTQQEPSAEDNIDIAKYEIMIYQLIFEKIEAGHVYLKNSISFKSLSEHLLSDEKWENKQSILKQLGNKKLEMSANQRLDDLEKELEELILRINKHIEDGTNKGIKVKGSDDEVSFTLPYPSADKENHPLFKKRTQVGISEVLQFAQSQCDFMKAFTHIKPYNAKDTLDVSSIKACIIANATNLGIHKMAENSDLDYHRMHTQMKNFLRLETLHDANDIITNAIASLPIFKHWNIRGDYIHGSVDGQKFETKLHSFIARYSSKYFGVNKGVVAYTLCANHIPVNAKIISANQHESHFLFDILFNNSSDVEIDWLSGDGHSINQINFTLLDFIGKQFAPQFKKISRKATKLCGFKPLTKYKKLFIKPKHQVNKKILRKEWDNMQRIIASLLLGEGSQNLLVSKLSSHKRKNKTKEALWEYDRILMSVYMLRYIDDLVIRQNVRRALNRGEAYHQLRRAIANVHGSKFRGRTDKEIELWNECARLMANCMIYYNATILNGLLLKLQDKGNQQLIELLQYISPVAWININLYGFYSFNDNKDGADQMSKVIESINIFDIE